MANFEAHDSDVSPITATLGGSTAGIPVTLAKWIQTGVTVGGENDLESVLEDFALEVSVSHTAEGSIRSEVFILADYERWTGSFSSTRAYTVGQEIKSTDGHYYRALRAVSSGGAAPTATTANWLRLAALDLETALFHEFLSGLGGHDDEGSIRSDIVRLSNVALWQGAWAARAFTEGQEVKAGDGNYYRALRAVADSVAEPTATTANWLQLDGLDLAIAQFHEQEATTRNSVPDFDEEPDAADYADGQIIFVGGGWKKRYSTHATAANQFAGTVGFYIRDGASFRGIAGPNRLSSYQPFGEFTANPNNATGMLAAHGSTMQVSIRADLYEAAKGSALASSDSVFVRLVGNGQETVECAYDLTYRSGGHSWYFFDGRPSGSRALNDVSDGDEITFYIDSDASETPLLTHDVATGHWVDWVPDGVKQLRDEMDALPDIEAGQNIAIDEDEDSITISAVIPEPLRYRAVISDDVRTTTEKYQIEYGGTSYTVPRSASRVNTFTPSHPNLPDGFDATKVNLFYDGGDHQFNPSGVDFTAESAGTTTRTIKCTLEIAPDPSQERSNNDIINLGILVFGRARSSVSSKRLAFANHQDYPFKVHFDLTYTNSPRGGLADAIAFTLQSNISRIKVIPKLTYFLPFTGATLPTQTYDQPGTSGHVVLAALSAEEHAQVVPEELTRGLAGGRIGLWEIPSGTTNNEGRNDPTEEDHSDSVRAALGSHGNVFVEATQDLSQLHLTLRQKAQVATNVSYEVYLCTYLRGVLAPAVVAHTHLFSGPPQWTIDYLGKGILKGQRFYMLARGVIGDAEMVWDATIQDAVRTVTIKPGFTTSREIVLGSAASTFTLGNIVGLPPVETWVKLRLFSSGLISTVDWPENYLEGFPTAAGQPSLTHAAIGPFSVHEQQSAGSIAHNRYIVPWQDGPDWKMSVYSGSSLDSVYLDKVELEYELLN